MFLGRALLLTKTGRHPEPHSSSKDIKNLILKEVKILYTEITVDVISIGIIHDFLDVQILKKVSREKWRAQWKNKLGTRKFDFEYI